MGCGSGRWARFVAPKVGQLNCIDPSQQALDVAKQNLREFDNCTFERATTEECSIKNCSQDFGYSLGVLHHIPDTLAAMQSCVAKLKPGAPFLIYIYYRFDNKPAWFKLIWHITNIVRKIICKLPFPSKLFITKIIAAIIYYPLARTSYLLELMGCDVKNIPLSYYRRESFYRMSTDSLDRFGTRLEHRFTKKEITSMMKQSGLESIRFSKSEPYWVAVGFKR